MKAWLPLTLLKKIREATMHFLFYPRMYFSLYVLALRAEIVLE